MRHKSPGFEQIPAELITERGREIRSDVYELISSIWNTKELLDEWKESIFGPIYRKCYNTDCIDYSGVSLFANY